MGVALYTLAALKPPFYHESISGLFNAILHKQQKPIVQYSSALSEFIFGMLQKKKVDRPLIVDLIDFFHRRSVVMK
jgi:DNA polymerase III epsilon subunit-like protein